MKKFFLTFIAAMLITPALLAAAPQKKIIRTFDITMDMPTAGMHIDTAEKLALKAVMTEYGDLFKSGAISIHNIIWDGEFGEDKAGYPIFQAGFSYRASLKIYIEDSKNYQANYIFKGGEYELPAENFKATVNGMQVRKFSSAPYFPSMSFTYTVPGGTAGPQKKESTFLDYDRNKSKYRSTLPYISQKEADELYPPYHKFDVLVLDKHDKFRKLWNDDFISSSGHTYPNHNKLLATKMIIDVSNGPSNANISEFAEDLGDKYSCFYNLKEIWLGPNVDATKYIKDLNASTIDPLFMNARNYCGQSTKMYTAQGTIVIPERYVKEVLTLLSRDKTEPTYTIRTYSGDVYAAQKAGLATTKPLMCPKHEFTARISAADRICQYSTCKQAMCWYYSCSICGKCERNKKHVFYMEGFSPDLATHAMTEELATDQAYIGVNAAGEHVYWKSCMYCGMSKSYHMKHLTPKDQKIMGVEGTFEQYLHAMKETHRTSEEQCLLHTTLTSDELFILPLKSKAKMSVWAQDGVNRALNDNLIDDAVLGSNYTLPVSRAQLCSIMTLLAKEMTERNVTAEKIGLNSNDLPKSGPVTRQELAAYIRRTLQYIENNSKYAYSAYDSKLARYTDQAQIKEWAKEAMAFCNALEIIDPKTSTTLAPNEACTIELALVAAERATIAHRTGWYQAVSIGEIKSFHCPGHRRNGYTGVSSFGNCDRMWVFRTKNGMYKELPTTDPHTGSRCYVDMGVVHPIRAKMGKGYYFDLASDNTISVEKTVDITKKKGYGKASGVLKKGLKGLMKAIK